METLMFLTSVTSTYMWPFNDDLMRFDFETDDDQIVKEATPTLSQCATESRLLEIMQM